MKFAANSFVYPQTSAERTRWILSQRGKKTAVDLRRPYAFLLEQERGPTGEMLATATIFLTNRECPWRCLMCDLWKNTTDQSIPAGAIPEQIEFALTKLPAARQIKLYNSGSFFDTQAIPREDWPVIARLVNGFERVVVECHPALVNEQCAEFASMIEGRLEIAIGLETVHPGALEKLNKRMTAGMFAKAAHSLREMDIDLRAFALVKSPFVDDAETLGWTKRTIDFAIECGASVVSLIPTRVGNGALDELMRQRLFAEPGLALLEEAHDYGVGLQRARVFADLWDLRRFSRCEKCFGAREARLHRMNCAQVVLPRIECGCA